MDDRPIGMFDSGFGGLTVARAVIDLLPEENLVYIGDTGRYPYGPRPLDEVRRFARQITAKLVDEHDVKMVVVACNTAAAAGLDSLRAGGDRPGHERRRARAAGGLAGHRKRPGRCDRHGRDHPVRRLPAVTRARSIRMAAWS